VSSKNTSSSQSMSDKRRANWECPRCRGWLREQVILDDMAVQHNVRTCVSCGHCEPMTPKEFPSGPLAQIHSPQTLGKPSKSTGKKRPHTALRKVSIPNLSPPPVPKTDEDLNGVYQIQRGTFDGYQHFRERAGFYQVKARRCRTLSDKMRADYRARLCANLAATLGKIYTRQTRTWLRDRLRRGQRAGHPVQELDRKVRNLYKQRSGFMLQAMDHLPDDPLVQTWSKIRKNRGDWDYLRRAKKGFEKGVKKPYPSARDALAELTMIELGAKGMTAGKILRKLRESNLPTLSRESIRKRPKSYPSKVVVGKIRKLLPVTGKRMSPR